MDFIEFLKSGSSGATKRIEFDGRYFKRQGEDINGINDYFELEGDNIREKGSGYTGFSLSKRSSDAFYGPLAYSIYKGSLTDYYIEIEKGIVTLKRGGSTVYNSDRYEGGDDLSVAESAPATADSDSPLILRLVIKLVLGYLIACFPPIIFKKFLKNAKRGSKDGNSFYLFAIFLGLIFFGGAMITTTKMNNSYGAFSFLSGAGKTGLFGIYIVYTVFHILNLLTFFLAKKIAKLLKSERAINIAFAVYAVVFVVLIVIFVALYLTSMKNLY